MSAIVREVKRTGEFTPKYMKVGKAPGRALEFSARTARCLQPRGMSRLSEEPEGDG